MIATSIPYFHGGFNTIEFPIPSFILFCTKQNVVYFSKIQFMNERINNVNS